MTTDNAPDRIWATVNGMSTRLPDGARQLIGGWSQDSSRPGVMEYVRADLTEITTLRKELAEARAENERLRAAISWIEPKFIDAKTTPEELRARIGYCVADAERASMADILAKQAARPVLRPPSKAKGEKK